MTHAAVQVSSPKRQGGVGSSVQNENIGTHPSNWAEEKGAREGGSCGFEVEVACIFPHPVNVTFLFYVSWLISQRPCCTVYFKEIFRFILYV